VSKISIGPTERFFGFHTFPSSPPEIPVLLVSIYIITFL